MKKEAKEKEEEEEEEEEGIRKARARRGRRRGRGRRGLAKCFVEKNPTRVLLASRVPLQEFFLQKKSKRWPLPNFSQYRE
jgi:hypothetical protein